jgi:hypothetical protein
MECSALNDSQQSKRQPGAGPGFCKECGKALRLLTELPMFGVGQSLRLIQCTGCGFVEWTKP